MKCRFEEKAHRTSVSYSSISEGEGVCLRLNLRNLCPLCHEYWEQRMANEPLFATALGDRRFDDRLPEITPQSRARVEKQYELIYQRARETSEEELSADEKLTRAALMVDVQAQLDYSWCRLEEWTVDPLGGPQVEFMNVQSYQPVRSPQEGDAMVKRWRAMGQFLDDHIANLRRSRSRKTCLQGWSREGD